MKRVTLLIMMICVYNNVQSQGSITTVVGAKIATDRLESSLKNVANSAAADFDHALGNGTSALLYALDKFKSNASFLIDDADRTLSKNESDIMNDVNLTLTRFIDNVENLASKELDKQVNSITQTMADSWLVKNRPSVFSYDLPTVIKNSKFNDQKMRIEFFGHTLNSKKNVLKVNGVEYHPSVRTKTKIVFYVPKSELFEAEDTVSVTTKQISLELYKPRKREWGSIVETADFEIRGLPAQLGRGKILIQVKYDSVITKEMREYKSHSRNSGGIGTNGSGRVNLEFLPPVDLQNRGTYFIDRSKTPEVWIKSHIGRCNSNTNASIGSWDDNKVVVSSYVQTHTRDIGQSTQVCTAEHGAIFWVIMSLRDYTDEIVMEEFDIDFNEQKRYVVPQKWHSIFLQFSAIEVETSRGAKYIFDPKNNKNKWLEVDINNGTKSIIIRPYQESMF